MSGRPTYTRNETVYNVSQTPTDVFQSWPWIIVSIIIGLLLLIGLLFGVSAGGRY